VLQVGVPVVVPPAAAEPAEAAFGGSGGSLQLLAGLTPAQQMGVVGAIAEAAQELAEEQEEGLLAEAELEAEMMKLGSIGAGGGRAPGREAGVRVHGGEVSGVGLEAAAAPMGVEV
jgi:hypothetical protein